ERQDAARLDKAAVGANDDTELDAVALEHGEFAALLVKGLVSEALAVGAEYMSLVRNHGRVVKIGAAQLIEANDQSRIEPAGAVEDFQHLLGVGRESDLAGQFAAIGVAGQKALREADDVDTLALGAFQATDD